MSAFAMDLEISRPVRILVGAFLVLAVFAVIVLPLQRRGREAAVKVRAARRTYAEAQEQARQYAALKSGADASQSVLLREQLFTYVEKTTRDLHLGKSLDSIRPENRTDDDGGRTEVVHLSFKGISLDDFVRLLYRIEVQKREIAIRNISIKKDAKRDLDMQLTLQKVG